MNFELSDEQMDIQKAALEFAQGEFDPELCLELDQSGQFPEAIWKKASRLGFIGVHYPEEFGGQGLGYLENLLVHEAFCRVDSGVGSALTGVDLGSEVLLRFGSKEQKRHFLPPLAKGEKRLSVAFWESEDESNFSSLSTQAERQGGKYLLNGRKRFVPNISFSDTFIVLCKESEEGWITLLVERENRNVEVHATEKMGLRMVPFGDLFLRKVWVPSEKRVGKEGEGIVQVHRCDQEVKLRYLGQALGIAQGALDRAAHYAKQREQFGRKLYQFQIIRHKLADMAIGIEVARFLGYQSATEYDRGKLEVESLPLSQLEVGRKLIEVVEEAVQIFGGYGYMAEQDIEHYYRDAWAIAAELGTEEELKDVIADRLLGPFNKK